MDRKASVERGQQRRRIKQQIGASDAAQFFNLKTGPQLLQTTEERRSARVCPGGREIALLRELYAAFEPADIAVGDALYCNYFVIASAKRNHVALLTAACRKQTLSDNKRPRGSAALLESDRVDGLALGGRSCVRRNWSRR